MVRRAPAAKPHTPGWDTENWPFEKAGVRILPVVHGRLEFARAVRAHLEAFQPQGIVIEIPAVARKAWLEAVAALPRISAISFSHGDDRRWLIVEPADPFVEAARWGIEHSVRVHPADLVAKGFPQSRDPIPDSSAMPETGYAAFCRALLESLPAHAPDRPRERALALKAHELLSEGQRVVILCGAAHVRGVLEKLEDPGPEPMVRPFRGEVSLHALADDCLVEVLSEPPFLQAAWERSRSGNPPCAYDPPVQPGKAARIITFPGADASREDVLERPEPELLDPDLVEEAAAHERGDDLLSRPRLLYRLVQQAGRLAHETSGSVPFQRERRMLHRYARNQALLNGQLCPDLYEMVVAARGCVDDRFARDLLRVGGYWPWGRKDGSGVHLKPEDLSRATRLLRLRPQIDRLARRPGLARALNRLEGWQPAGEGICSHPPEDLVVEAVGEDLRELGSDRAARAGVRVHPFTSSILDGIDFRETLRRYIVDGRPWVREEIPAHSQVGAVIVDFEEEGQVEGGTAEQDEQSLGERFPWAEVWHGEHAQESDMAFYATDPKPGRIAPGIHRAEYGAYLLIWPPRRLGDLWHDPAYNFCQTRLERLIVAGLDYSRKRLVVLVSLHPPREVIRSVARQLGRAIVHVPPGVLPLEKRRRLRTFHVLAGRKMRRLAREIIDE